MGFFISSGHSAHFLYQGWMKMHKIDPVLYERLSTLVSGMGYELVGYEIVSQGHGQTFRIYIDKFQGVTVDDCGLVSRQVGAMLDVMDPMQGRYLLEVSSPGIDRPLFTLEHYKKYIGMQVKVRLVKPVVARRHFKGLLTRVENGNIYLQIEGVAEEIELPFSLIERGNIIGEL